MYIRDKYRKVNENSSGKFAGFYLKRIEQYHAGCQCSCGHKTEGSAVRERLRGG